MNEDGTQDLRQLLQQQADRAPQPSGLRPTTVRRARAHRFGLAAVTCVALVAVVVTGIRITTAVSQRNGTPGVIRIPPAKHKQTAKPTEEIAFTRWAKKSAIDILEENGQIRQVITNGGYAIAGPAWSPNGKKIAFHGFYGKAANEAGGLFSVNVDGGHLKLLQVGGAEPTWSPNGKRIAFYSARSGFLSVVDADGHNARTVTRIEGDAPTWSPDGTWIAFDSNGRAIYVVRPDGSKLHRIATSHRRWRLTEAAWSPNGRRIAYTRYRTGTQKSDIYTMKPDGSDATLLVRNALEAAWSPNGSEIAFSRNGAANIYSINADGSGMIQLTSGPAADFSPAWRP
ncbi:MAG: hypothetical protein M3P01_07495 [Actinomycetota bacterium]|nr:hypothetical protein [Actinomycetota bacterium]